MTEAYRPDLRIKPEFAADFDAFMKGFPRYMLADNQNETRNGIPLSELGIWDDELAQLNYLVGESRKNLIEGDADALSAYQALVKKLRQASGRGAFIPSGDAGILAVMGAFDTSLKILQKFEKKPMVNPRSTYYHNFPPDILTPRHIRYYLLCEGLTPTETISKSQFIQNEEISKGNLETVKDSGIRQLTKMLTPEYGKRPVLLGPSPTSSPTKP